MVKKATSLKQLSRSDLEAQVEHANLAIGLLQQRLENEQRKIKILLEEREYLRSKFLVRWFKWLD